MDRAAAGRQRTRAGRTARLATAGVALAMVLGACGSGEESSSAGSSGASKAGPLYAGIGSASAEYWSAYVEGVNAVGKSVEPPQSVKVLSSEFEGQRHLEQFGAIFAKGCEGCSVSVDPASQAFTKALVTRADRAGTFIVTVWNRPEQIHPYDTASEHWVAHTSFDGVDSGYRNAKVLFEEMGGKGKIVALGGISDNPPAKQRLAGLKKALAENPDIELLETQAADWDQTKAQTITETWLSKYGDDITGVFSANDSMALGVVEALRAKDLAGKVPVTGSDGSADVLQLVKNGEMVSTMYVDSAYQGAHAQAMAYAAASGKLDPAKLPKEQRDFNLDQTLVTKDNVDEFLTKKPDPKLLSYQAISKDFWAQSAGPIPAGANK